MARLSSSKKTYSLTDFAVARGGEQAVSADTVKLLHNGDFITLSVAHRPEVSSITITIKKRVQKESTDKWSVKVTSDRTTAETVVINSGDAGYEITLKEDFTTPAGSGTQESYTSNVDITVTLKSVKLSDSTEAVIGQEPSATGSVLADDILNAVGWVLGGLACIMTAYVIYRFYKHFRHGEALFPRLNKLMGRGEE